MSWLPPFSRAGTVLAPSRATLASSAPVRVPARVFSSSGGRASGRDPVGVGVDQGLLALVPLGQQLRRGGGAEQPGVGDAGVADAGQVPGGGHLAVEVPDRLVGVGVVVGEEPAGVGLGEDAGVAPALAGGRARLLGDRAEVEDVDHQQVAGLGALDLDGAAEHVGVGQVDVADVVGGVVVAELGVGPLAALDPELAAGLHEGGTGVVGVPAVVAGDGLVAHGLGLVDAEHHVWHERHLPCWVRGCLVLSLAAVTSGRGAGTPTKPACGSGRAWRAVGERLAGGNGRHTRWTLL